MRRAARRDANEPDIVSALRHFGATVQPLDAKGVPDLLVGHSGKNYLLEVKEPEGVRGGRSKKGQRLNELQVLWHMKWRGQCVVVRTVNEALAVIGVRLEER
jgi:hypothetical protein